MPITINNTPQTITRTTRWPNELQKLPKPFCNVVVFGRPLNSKDKPKYWIGFTNEKGNDWLTEDGEIELEVLHWLPIAEV